MRDFQYYFLEHPHKAKMLIYKISSYQPIIHVHTYKKIDLETTTVMELASNHSISGWGWQQNNSFPKINGTEEQNLYNQAKAFNQFVTTNNNNHYNKTQSTFVYRSGFEAAIYWNSSMIMNDASYSGFWIKNKDGNICMQPQGPIYNFSNESAVEYYLNNVIKQTFKTKPYINQVFFDMTDWLSCDFNWTQHSNCTEWQPSYQQKREFGFNAIKVFQQATKIMNDNGIIPSISIRTVFSKYMNKTIKGDGYCVVPEEEWIDALQNLTWFRYQEYFPDLFGGSTESLSFLNMIEELNYAKNKLPIQVHAYNVNPNATISPYFLGTFLIAQQDYSYFGASNGWYDDNWSWHESYNKIYGKPLSMPVQLNDTAWFRHFENCNVTIDINKRSGDIKMF